MNDNLIFPKVLIVTSSAIDEMSQTAITLRNIWGMWPKDRIMNFVVNGEKRHGQHDDNSYYVPHSRQPIALLAKSKLANSLNTELKSTNRSKSTEKSRKSKNESIKAQMRQYIYSVIDRSPIFLKREDTEVVKSFGPDIIYTMGSTVTLLRVAVALSETVNKRILLHFMDNWAETIQWGNNIWLGEYQKSIRKWLTKAYRHSSCALTISEEMAVDYEKRSGIRHIPLMNSVDLEKWKCPVRAIGSEITFIYAGGLHLGRNDTIRRIYESLKANSNETLSYRMIVYTNLMQKAADELKQLADGRSLIVKDSIPHEALCEAYMQADALVLAEALSGDAVTELFTKYSISTKTAEYLSTGKPILYVGNQERELPRYLLKNNAAVVVNDVTRISDAIHQIVDKYETISKNAKRLAFEKHNKENTVHILRYAIQFDGKSN